MKKTLQQLANELETSLERLSKVRRGAMESLLPTPKSVDYNIKICPDCGTLLSEPYRGELECGGCGATFL